MYICEGMNMKKTAALLLSWILVILLSACVPEKQLEILEIGPDPDGVAGTPVDFDVLGRDTMEGISDMEPYGFVVRTKIDGSNDTREVRVTVGTDGEVPQEDDDAFVAALMRSMGISAGSELKEYNEPAKDSFGDFWNTYSLTVEFYNDDEMEQEGAKPYYVFEHKAGEAIPLNPDVEKYAQNYYKVKEILERSL